MLDIPDELMDRVSKAASDEKLVEHIRTATAGRFSSIMLMPAGLFAVRYLAAAVLATSDDEAGFGPAEAMAVVLNAISDRVGKRRNVWLNSLKLIGGKIYGDTKGGSPASDRLYVHAGKPQFLVAKPQPARKPTS